MRNIKYGIIVNYEDMAEMIKEKIKKCNKKELEDLLLGYAYPEYDEEEIEKLFISPILNGSDIKVTPDFEQEIYYNEDDVYQSLCFEVEVNNNSFYISEYNLVDIFKEYNKVLVDYAYETIALVNAE